MEKISSREDAGTGLLIGWYWVPVLAYAAVIFYLSSLPHPEDDLPDFLLKKLSDKFLHLVEYAVLGLLCYRALRWTAGPSMARRAVMITIIAVSFYGMTDEVHQAFVPFRESSWLDWVADTVGGALGAIGMRQLSQRRVSSNGRIDASAESS
jgi:VanZ family protein